jgi:hypothetical protein
MQKRGKIMTKVNRLILLSIFAILILIGGLAHGREETPIDKLTVGGTIINCEFVDLNNDRLREALVFYDDESSGELTRRMAVFASERKRYNTQSRQIIDIDRSVVCYDLADIDGDGDQDLVLMTNKGVAAHLCQNGIFNLAMSDIIRDTTIFGTGLVENIVRWEFVMQTDTVSKNLVVFVPTI